MSAPCYVITTTDKYGKVKDYPGGCASDSTSMILSQNLVLQFKRDPLIVEIIVTDDWGSEPKVVKRV